PVHLVGAVAQHARAQHRLAPGLRAGQRIPGRPGAFLSGPERGGHQRPRAGPGALRLINCRIAGLQEGSEDSPAMSVVVQKYGGSSVADVSKMRTVAERVMKTRREGHDVVVVVSAMGDTTDELMSLAKQVSPNPARRELDMLLTAGERISMAL